MPVTSQHIMGVYEIRGTLLGPLIIREYYYVGGLSHWDGGTPRDTLWDSLPDSLARVGRVLRGCFAGTLCGIPFNPEAARRE